MTSALRSVAGHVAAQVVTRVLLAVGVLLSSASLAAPFTMAAFQGKVVAVADGDTLTVLREDKTQVRIRLYGIDAPERGQPFGERAKQFTSELAFGKVVRMEPTNRDLNQRFVAAVILPDGRNLNHELVRAGLAWSFRRYAPKDKELARLGDEARAARRGLWVNPHPVPPWEWRGRRTAIPWEGRHHATPVGARS